MDSSATTTPDKLGSETSHSQSVNSSIQKSDQGIPPCSREKRRREHNDMEKKRKEQIKACICKMGELLPPSYVTSERHSTLEIVEKSLNYMRELKEARTKFTVIEDGLNQELNALKAERDKFSDIIKAAGLSTESIPTNGVSSTTDVKDESPKPKSKSKKRTTLGSQLQQLNEQKEKFNQQQEMISSSVSVSEDSSGNLHQNQLMNMPAGPFLNGQNVMFNPMMNQYMMPGMVANGNQMIPMGMMTPGAPNMTGVPNNNQQLTPQSVQNTNSQTDLNTNNQSVNKDSEDSDAGLLQLAMQDAGITPGSNSGQPSASALTPVSDSGQEAESSSTNALQTLASIATSDQNMSVENTTTMDMQNMSNNSTSAMGSNNANMSVMTSTQSGLQPMLQNSNNGALINMPMLGNQSGLPGQQQQPQMQQIMFFNEQGIPMIANVPVGIDPNNPNMFQNSQKQQQGLVPGLNQHTVIKDQSGNIDQNALALAQQQANIAALQNQLLGQGAGATMPNMPFQQNMLQGNIIQTPNGQLLQQIGPQINGQGQIIGMQGQGQGIVVAGQQNQLPASQNSNFLTLNTTPSQPNQLPSALILPNGQIIPVVTNPGNVVTQPNQAQLTQPRMSGPHIQTGMDGQIFSVANSQGLLIPAASTGQVMSSSTAASLSTSVVPTSAIQSVMTTQIQGSSVQTQKPISASSVASSNQTKLINSSGITQQGAKPTGTPILLSLPVNGQPTTVLLDPVTMQVFGTVQPGQQSIAQPGIGNVIMAPTSTATAGATTSQASTTVTGSKSKNKNNANQRAICPKPLGEGGHKSSATPGKKKRPSQKSSAKNKETAPADSLSDTLQIQIPESTTDPEVSSAVSSGSTDILAKAAESIFSSPTGEITNVGGGFYNPANEDNPLHIDTSATEVDDDSKSPRKRSKKVSGESTNTTRALQDNVLGLNSVADAGKTVAVTKVINTSEKSELPCSDSVTSLSATFEEIAGMQFGEEVPPPLSEAKNEIVTNEANKTNKKSKHSSGKSSENKKADSKSSGKTNSSKISKSKKQVVKETTPVLELEKTDSDSQSMDIESTLIHIPDNISFSENDLSDVLDQVEQMGNTVSESMNNAKSSKKSKSKRSKAPDAENEPSSKKRKSGKEVKDSPSGSKNTVQAKEILSMPTTLSVYDFDDSDDVVPLILPLNGKDFTALSSTPGQDNFVPTESEESNGAKTDTKSKVSAQNKPKKNSKSAKNSKDSENSTQKVGNDVQNNDPLFDMKDMSQANKRSYPVTDKVTVSETSSNKSSLPSMPEIDTTTSIFGIPIPPKKMPRPDLVSQQNTQPKPQQMSPKLNLQSPVPEVSPKDNNIISPKSATSMVSPRQSSFTPELMSPKLSIVSPGQNLMSDDDIRSSPKQYTEMSPVTKRSPLDKHHDMMKVSPFSALNSVPLSDTSSDTFMPVDNKLGNNKTPVSLGHNQSMSVITSAKTLPSGNSDSKKLISEQKVPDDTNHLKKKVPDNVVNIPPNNSGNNGPVSQPSGRNSASSRDKKFNNPNVAVSSANNMLVPPAQRTQTSVNSSQNNRYGNQFSNDPMYGTMSNMDNRQLPSKDTAPRSSMNNYTVPCSADTLFNNSQAEKVIKSPPNVNISTLNQKPDTSNMSKLRNNNNAYSVDNFVSSRDEGIRSRPDSLVSHSDLISNTELGNPSTDFSRLQSESSPDGFNFANIGLNLQPITSNIPSSFMDNSSTAASNMSSSFSFSLSSTSSTVTTSAGGLGHHQFPFFPPVLSSSSSVPASQTSLPASMPSMDLYDPSNASNNVIQRNNTVMHPSGTSLPRVDSNSMSRGDSMQHNDKGPIIPDDNTRDQGSKPSCSKQKMNKGPGPAAIQEPFSAFPNTSGGTDPNYFHDTQMKSNVGKSPTEQMRKSSQDKMMDMNSSHSRSSSQASLPDKRNNAMDRSPQMMSNSQSYYPSNYPSSKSLNTPPLHHPVMMPPDDRSRNMTNRSPYDTPFPPPPSSQGFNAMGVPYPGNRFDNGPPSFSRDNSGTQPLSHTPVNSGGRKSANPPSQSSVVKPPQKQSAPPLVPMGGPQQAPPSQGQRPSSQQAHRATTPHGSQQGQTPAPSAVSQSRQPKQQSRNKPPSSKKSKTLPFMEVDSNLSNSIFEPNRSMTPFFPMQNLSPQSRMQHEGPPFLPGNLFGPGPRFPNSTTPMPKNSDFSSPYLFPRGAQNGLGLNFQPGFGMNMNPLHGNHGNGPQLTPHTAPHMANFSLNNIITDGPAQNESSLNISPIKFPHTNYQGMEHNAMQHHHQYNRGHPSVMSINSILGPNHHGFDGRMNTSMAGPFHSHGHPSFIPPLNFSMHDH